MVLFNAIKLHQGKTRVPTGNCQHAVHLARELARCEGLDLKCLVDVDSEPLLASDLTPEQRVRTDFVGDSVLAADRVVVRAVRELKPDVYYRPTGQLPFGLGRVKAVACIADLNFTVLKMPWPKKLYKQVSYRWTVHRADWITCISEFTRADVIRRLGADQNRTSVVHLAPVAFPKADLSLVREIGPGFWLTFGHERHKNVEICLRALAGSRQQDVLVVVGATGWIDEILKPLAASLGVTERVRFVGKVSGAQLHGLYQAAGGLLFMSRYEGFGLPLLEAMNGGVPVICSNCCSIPEVAGDAAVILDPDDVAGLEAAMTRIRSDPEFRSGLVARGRVRAGHFSWRRAAEETAAVLRRVWGGAIA